MLPARPVDVEHHPPPSSTSSRGAKTKRVMLLARWVGLAGVFFFFFFLQHHLLVALHLGVPKTKRVMPTSQMGTLVFCGMWITISPR